MRAQCGLENVGRKARRLESTKGMATVFLHSWTWSARRKVNPYDCVTNSPRCRWLSTVGALSWVLYRFSVDAPGHRLPGRLCSHRWFRDPGSFRLTFAGSFMSSLFTWQMGDRAWRAARGGLTPLPVEVTCFTSFHTASARDQLPDPNLCVERLGIVFRCGKRMRVRQADTDLRLRVSGDAKEFSRFWVSYWCLLPLKPGCQIIINSGFVIYRNFKLKIMWILIGLLNFSIFFQLFSILLKSILRIYDGLPWLFCG